MKIERDRCCGHMLTDMCDDCPVYAAREEAIGRAIEHNKVWLVEAMISAETVMRRQRTFTPDDIWFDLWDRQIPDPHDRRAMTGVSRALLGRGAVRLIDYTYSVRPLCHGRRIPVYQVL